MSQLRIAGKIKYDWERLGKFDTNALETFMRSDKYRNVQSSGKQNQICNECSPNEDNHLMLVWYRYCSSVKCNIEDSEECPFQYKIIRF